jgi:succinyl-diaminopimelate desuccinylase
VNNNTKNEISLFDLTKKLIEFKSISPNQAGGLDYLQQLLEQNGFTTTRLDRNDTSNLIAKVGTSGPIFAFAGHIDVVPAGDIKKWEFNPFELTEHDGHLYGRGIGDMKGAVAAFIVAVTNYLKNNKLNGQIAILLTSDEESSAIDGTPVIVEYLKKHNKKIDYCLLGEPTSVEDLGDTIKIGRRGSLTGEIEVLGQQGHIAYPELCINPIHMFANALAELTQTIWDNGNDSFPPTSFQFANLNSGLGVTNVVPNSLIANFNFRYNDLHTADRLAKQVEAILDKYQVHYNITWINSAKPFRTKSGKLLDVIQNSIQENLSTTPTFKTDGGTSDGRFLIEVCNELVEFGLSNKYIHQINERIKSSDLSNLSRTYYSILHKIFN